MHTSATFAKKGNKAMIVKIDGVFMDCSLNVFQQRCEVLIESEQDKLSPDLDIINVLCDAIRLTREMSWKARQPIEDTREALRMNSDCHICHHDPTHSPVCSACGPLCEMCRFATAQERQRSAGAE